MLSSRLLSPEEMAGTEKGRVRRNALQRLSLLTHFDLESEITESVCSLNEYQEAHVVSVYISTRKELSTKKLVERLYADQKTVLVPFWGNEIMQMTEMSQKEYNALLKKPKEYFKKKYGHSIPMPDPETSVPYKGPIDLIIVPGLAFSSTSFHRIGYGFGHYDRYLNSSSIKTIIGICHDCQLVDPFHTEQHDIPMDIIITPHSIKYNNQL